MSAAEPDIPEDAVAAVVEAIIAEDDRLSHAPWTAEQITQLNAWQSCGWVHPFTCGKRDDHKRNDVLVATEAGWVCPFPGCDYTQGWAHKVMTGPTPPNPFAAFMSAIEPTT